MNKKKGGIARFLINKNLAIIISVDVEHAMLILSLLQSRLVSIYMYVLLLCIKTDLVQCDFQIHHRFISICEIILIEVIG